MWVHFIWIKLIERHSKYYILIKNFLNLWSAFTNGVFTLDTNPVHLMSLNTSVPCFGLFPELSTVWKQLCLGTHELCLRLPFLNKEMHGSRVWPTLTFKTIRCLSWKASLLLVYWWFANQLFAYCHLLYWTVYYICKQGREKADQQGRGGGGQTCLGTVQNNCAKNKNSHRFGTFVYNWFCDTNKSKSDPKKVWPSFFCFAWNSLWSSLHKLCTANLSKPQASQITAGMVGFPPNPSMYTQAPGGYSPAPQPSGYGAPIPNQQSYGLYPQPGGPMPQPPGPGMGYPGQPGQPMPGYPRAPSPNPPMAGYGGAPAPMPGYPKVPSPNPSMPAYGGGIPGGSTMPIAPPVNVNMFV